MWKMNKRKAVLMSDEEFNRLKLMAEYNNMNLSRYIRTLINNDYLLKEFNDRKNKIK